MQLETFSKDGVNGYKIIGATFASSKNHNGAYFDPVEVFADEINENFNLAHKDYSTDYSTGTTITKAPEAKLEGKLLRFTWDLETTNENFINLIEKEEFGGFSPELEPTGKPVLGKEIGKDKNGNPVYERFYSQNLKWKSTAILTKDQKAGFVGAKDFALEKFEAYEIFEDVVIKKVEDKIEVFGVKTDLEERLIWSKRDMENITERIKELEVAIEALRNANLENKLNFSKENNNDDLIDQKARLEADIAKLTAEKETKTLTFAQNVDGLEEKLTKIDSVVNNFESPEMIEAKNSLRKKLFS